MPRKSYSTDISDEQWQLIEPWLPPAKSTNSRGRKRTVNVREIVNGIFYWSRTGCAWELLPHDFPPPKTVYHYFRKWQKLGIWSQINQVLSQKVRLSEARAERPTASIIDSQSVKTTEMGGSERGFDGGKKVKGRKRHLVVDTLGLVLVVLVHAANIADVTGARMMLADLCLTQPTVEYLWADQGYQGARLQEVSTACNIRLEIVKRNSKEFEVLPRRWVVERTFAWLNKQRRLSKDYEKLPEVSEALVHVAMIPLLLNRLTA